MQLKEINVLGLVVTVPDITLMDTHDGGHPENFIDDMRKKGKLDGLKYTYWNRAICPRCFVPNVIFYNLEINA
ncbi:hypothetical protein ACOSQ2_011722 [Xanthoceras sorbifolium]